MKTAIKIIAVLFVLIVLLIAGLVFFAFSKIDTIAKEAIERGGTYAMGVTTTVDEVDVGLRQGTVVLAGLEIDNPSGFNSGDFFTLESSDASLDIASINTDTIIVPTFNLSGIDVILDKGNDPSNYNRILENLKRFESGGSDNAQNGGKDVIIKSLVIEDIDIRVANMPGISLIAGDIAVQIPRIELLNVGEAESMKAGDIFNLVIKTVLSAAVEAGGGIFPADVLGDLLGGLSDLSSLSDLGIDVLGDLDIDNVLNGVFDGGLDQVGEQLEEVTDQANEVIDDITKEGEKIQDEAEKVVDEVTDTFNNIFGKKKKEDD